jgi:hypothetical protein
MVTINRREWAFCGLAAFLLIAALWATGWTSPWITLDTPSYLEVRLFPDFYFAQRLPLYGWFVAMLAGTELGYAPVIWAQVLLHTIAAVSLFASVRSLGAANATAGALFLAALCSQAFLIYGRGIVPESPAISFALIAVSATLAAARDARWALFAVGAGCSAAVAYMLRPAFVLLIVTLPLLVLLARRLRFQSWTLRRAAVLLAAASLPLALHAGLRMRYTHDFNIAAYGGFQSSGMAGLMLSPTVIERLPAEDRDLATQILAARTRAEAQGRVIPTPENSTGQRSFASAAAGYFDIYARTYDALLHDEIERLQRPDESWVEFDHRLGRLTLATIRAVPLDYAAWLVGASARLVGRMLVTNGPFVLACVGLFAALLWALRRPESIRSLDRASDVVLLVLVVGIYILAAAPMGVLLTFPAARYIDTAAVLLPALPLYAAFHLVEAPGKE